MELLASDEKREQNPTNGRSLRLVSMYLSLVTVVPQKDGFLSG